MRGYLIDNNNSILASALTKVLGQNVDDRIREVYKFDLKFKDDELIEVKLDANIESGLYNKHKNELLSLPKKLRAIVEEFRADTEKELLKILR